MKHFHLVKKQLLSSEICEVLLPLTTNCSSSKTHRIKGSYLDA